ncbi:hypothetical protein DRJ19_04840 [Candidatus Woesearchaeota archaeon]|nr:MAG: hypothetical protein DRJ19_04840 [Candidatus Woesearchaeota archaeon]
MAPDRDRDGIRRPLRDKDYVKIKSAFLQVVGYEHPPGSIIAFPKYVKTNTRTPWTDGVNFYARMAPFYGAYGIDFSLKMVNVAPLVYDEVFDSYVPKISLNSIECAYHIEDALSRLDRKAGRLENTALELIDEILSLSNIQRSKIGLTGSLLIGVHSNEISDIDLVVIGLENILRVKEAIIESGVIRPPSVKVAEQWALSGFSHGLRLRDALFLVRRKWYRGLYKGVAVSISGVDDEGVMRGYGVRRYKGLGEISIVTRISKVINPFFTPVEYEVAMLGTGPKIDVIASYDGFYADVLKPGDVVEVRGLLQRVVEKDASYLRIVVGVREVPDSYIRVIEAREAS